MLQSARPASIILFLLCSGCADTTYHSAPNPGDQQSLQALPSGRHLEPGKRESATLIKGERTIVGTVRNVTGDQIEVDVGEMQTRFLALKEAKEKGFSSVERGDKLKIVLNEQNLVVDAYPLDEQQSRRRVRGHLAQPLVVGHERAIIQTETGREETYAIRPLARSKISSIPVGTPAVFLIDSTNQIVDGTFENQRAALMEASESAMKSPLKGTHRRIEGTIVEPLQLDKIRIRTQGGEDVPYEVRPLVQSKLAELRRGQSVILLIDNDGKVIDVAIPPVPKG